MYSANLSKLVLSNYLFEVFKEESIHFDWIISDFSFENSGEKTLLFNKNLDTLLVENKIKKTDPICIILDKATTSLLGKEIFSYENVVYICTFSGISSLGYKIAPERISLKLFDENKIENWFPFDLQTLITTLKKTGLHAIHLTNQEVAENIYDIQSEEEIAIIDKALIDQPETIHLINTPEAQNLIIGFGNYFEELVKLSEYLLTQEETYHFLSLVRLGNLSSEEIKLQAKKAKKIQIIIDQKETTELKTLLAQKLGTPEEKIKILTPMYQNLTTTLAEYQLEQSEFDVQQLANRIQNQ